MNIAKALKVKNRLVGEVNRLKEIIRRENSRRDDNPSKIDVNSVVEEFLKASTRLSILKGEIQKANVGIFDSLALLEESKNSLNWLKTLPTREGEEVDFIGRDQEKLTHKWTAYYNQERLDKEVKKLEDFISLLQDGIDEYNAKTTVNFKE